MGQDPDPGRVPDSLGFLGPFGATQVQGPGPIGRNQLPPYLPGRDGGQL